MRVPIVEYPEIVRRNLPQFEPVFANKNQVKHFCEYVTGLIVGEKATIQAINALFLNKNAQSALNKFLTQAVWDEKVSDDTGTFRSLRILSSTTKDIPDVLVGRRATISNQLVNAARRLSMNCWVIWFAGLLNIYNRAKHLTIFFIRCSLDCVCPALRTPGG